MGAGKAYRLKYKHGSTRVIFETVITTRNSDGGMHITPMGIRYAGDRIIIAPFRPSTTLENLSRTGQAVINMTDDVSIIAGCLTGRGDWPTTAARTVDADRLSAALSHVEVEVESFEDDELRPQFVCRERHRETHASFRGFNRAQAAVVEAAILVSRLHLLSADKIDRDIEYLSIAIEKTAGDKERQAWDWLLERIHDHRSSDLDTGNAA